MGENAANSLAKASQKGKYISIDEVQARTGISNSIIEMMDEIGMLEGIPKSSQMSFF